MAPPSSPTRYWRSELNKVVLTTNFERRGWHASTDGAIEQADLLWCAPGGGGALEAVFGAEGLVKLRPGQLINHYPNHQELTNKVIEAVHSDG